MEGSALHEGASKHAPPVRQRSVDFMPTSSNKVAPAPSQQSLGSNFLDSVPSKRRKSNFQSAAENMISGDQEGAKASSSGGRWQLPVFFPYERRYLQWVGWTMAVALVTAVLDPYNLAFVDNAGIYPYYDFWACTDYVASATFIMDIGTKFFLAYKDEKRGMVTDHKSIARRYLSLMFWVDIAVAAPLDGIISNAGLGYQKRDESINAQYIALVRWMKVGRLYRLFDLFALIEHRLLMSQMTLMLLRNCTYIFYIVHWLACTLYYVARVDGFSENSWLGREIAWDRVEGQHEWVRYLYSLYLATGVFTGVGDEVFYANSPAEVIILGVYLMLNVAIQAYILGTMTIVMVKKDVESQAYRNSVTTLNEFAEANDLPPSLYQAMRDHVELKFYSERTADEQVLQFYPSTIKRKVLRHLYLDVLKDCYLFAGCKERFLDQVLAVVRMELFMPNVPILSEGDLCNELFIIVDGEVAMAAPTDRGKRRGSTLDLGPALDPEFLAEQEEPPGEQGLAVPGMPKKFRRCSFVDATATNAAPRRSVGEYSEKNSEKSDAASNEDPSSHVRRASSRASSVGSLNDGPSFGRRKSLGADSSFGGSVTSFTRSSSGAGTRRAPNATTFHSSEPLSEPAFFAETAVVADAWTNSVTRVLVINREMFEELHKAFPQEVTTILRNLLNRCEQRLRTHVTEAMLSAQLDEAMGDELHEVLGGKSFSIVPDSHMLTIKGSLTTVQRVSLEEYENIRKLLKEDLSGYDEEQMFLFLSSASTGEIDNLRQQLHHGVDVNAKDYDGRSALMLACRENQEEAVELLLRSHADAARVDNFGYSALFEAVRMGHDDIIQLLQEYRAPLNVDPLIINRELFKAVKECKADQVKRFLHVGVDPNSVDFEGRTALHLAAASGSLTIVRALVEEGHAVIDVADNLGRKPIHDAQRGGHDHVVAYLKKAAEQSRRDSTLLGSEMGRLADEGCFDAVTKGRPMSATSTASAASTRSAHRRALRAASPMLSMSSGSSRSIGLYRKSGMDTAHNGSPASLAAAQGESSGKAPHRLSHSLQLLSDGHALAFDNGAAAGYRLTGNDSCSGSGNEDDRDSRGSMPSSVRLSPEPRSSVDGSVLPSAVPRSHGSLTERLRAHSARSTHGAHSTRSRPQSATTTQGVHTGTHPSAHYVLYPPDAADTPGAHAGVHPGVHTGVHAAKGAAGVGAHVGGVTTPGGDAGFSAGVRPSPPPVVPAEASALYATSRPASPKQSQQQQEEEEQAGSGWEGESDEGRGGLYTAGKSGGGAGSVRPPPPPAAPAERSSLYALTDPSPRATRDSGPAQPTQASAPTAAAAGRAAKTAAAVDPRDAEAAAQAAHAAFAAVADADADARAHTQSGLLPPLHSGSGAANARQPAALPTHTQGAAESRDTSGDLSRHTSLDGLISGTHDAGAAATMHAASGAAVGRPGVRSTPSPVPPLDLSVLREHSVAAPSTSFTHQHHHQQQQQRHHQHQQQQQQQQQQHEGSEGEDDDVDVLAGGVGTAASPTTATPAPTTTITPVRPPARPSTTGTAPPSSSAAAAHAPGAHAGAGAHHAPFPAHMRTGAPHAHAAAPPPPPSAAAAQAAAQAATAPSSPSHAPAAAPHPPHTHTQGASSARAANPASQRQRSRLSSVLRAPIAFGEDASLVDGSDDGAAIGGSGSSPSALTQQQQQQQQQQRQRQGEPLTARDLESVPEGVHAWGGPRLPRAARGSVAPLEQQQRVPPLSLDLTRAAAPDGRAATAAAATDRGPRARRSSVLMRGPSSGATSARTPHELLQQQQPPHSHVAAPGAFYAPAAAAAGTAGRRMSQVLAEQEAWRQSGRGDSEDPGDGASSYFAHPGRPSSVPTSLLDMTMDLPYPHGNTTRSLRTPRLDSPRPRAPADLPPTGSPETFPPHDDQPPQQGRRHRDPNHHQHQPQHELQRPTPDSSSSSSSGLHHILRQISPESMSSRPSTPLQAYQRQGHAPPTNDSAGSMPGGQRRAQRYQQQEQAQAQQPGGDQRHQQQQQQLHDLQDLPHEEPLHEQREQQPGSAALLGSVRRGFMPSLALTDHSIPASPRVDTPRGPAEDELDLVRALAVDAPPPPPQQSQPRPLQPPQPAATPAAAATTAAAAAPAGGIQGGMSVRRSSSFVPHTLYPDQPLPPSARGGRRTHGAPTPGDVEALLHAIARDSTDGRS